MERSFFSLIYKTPQQHHPLSFCNIEETIKQLDAGWLLYARSIDWTSYVSDDVETIRYREQAFADLAISNSDDTGSAENGGLIEDIAAAQGLYVQPFTDWAVDPAREPGDTGIVETEYGYHVMYYVGDDELTYRDSMISEEILAESVSNWYDEMLAGSEAVEKDTSLLNKDITLGQ